MPLLSVTVNNHKRHISFSPGPSAIEILRKAGITIRSGCRGNGACGLCLVQTDNKNAGKPTKPEAIILSPQQLESGIRLACQVIPLGDLHLKVMSGADRPPWQKLTVNRCFRINPVRDKTPKVSDRCLRQPISNRAVGLGYGLAIDLGTTNISLTLWDLKNGRRIAGRIGPNPQSGYGADVVTRLIAAGESARDAQWIARLPLDAVNEALTDMCAAAGLASQEVTRIVIVGNTPMLTLLTKSDSRVLLEPSYWTKAIECKMRDTDAWVKILEVSPRAKIEVVTPLAGFVGSDLLAGVLVTRLMDKAGNLLIDFGTNSELALWDGKKLRVTSAAGGPAFEGSGIKCGLPAEPGAIFRVEKGQNSNQWRFRTLGGKKAQGFCGSGLVDLIACLRENNTLTSTGTFTGSCSTDGFIIRRNGLALNLSKRDIDVFARAKAAIGAGIKTLLMAAGMKSKALHRVFVCGAFGRNLNILNAQAIGLLPGIKPGQVKLCGNSALAGCEQVLLSAQATGDLTRLRQKAAIINMAQTEDFESLFLENLYLQPLRID